MSDHLKKIEEELLPEIEIAATKGNMNRVITALRASLAALVEHAKEVADAAAVVAPVEARGGGIPTTPPKKPKAPARTAKKAPAKKTAE